MTRNRVAAAACAVLAVLLTACGGSAQQGGRTSTSIVLNWFPEPEHGEFFGAQVSGAYKSAGLDVKIVSGGPQISAVQLVASGKADFGVSDGDSIALARAQGIPVVAVGADFQTNPQILLYHPDSGISKPEDISGHTVYVSPGVNFWPYLKKKYGIKPAKEVAYNGSLAPFVADNGAVNQGYVTSEPYTLEHEQHTQVKWFLNADLGYNPYVTTFTTERMVKEHPDLVRKFVQTSVKGWDYYFQHSKDVNAAIGKQNRDMSQGQMAYTAGVMKPLVYGDGGVAGVMTQQRWATLVDELTQTGALHAGSVKPASCFTSAYVKKG